MAKIPIILEPGRADGKLIKTNSVYDDNQEKFLSDKIKEIDDNHNNLTDKVNTLTEVVNNNELDIENKLETEKTRATTAENNLRKTINNITKVNENATSANVVTIDTIPNTSSSNVQQALNELFNIDEVLNNAIATEQERAKAAEQANKTAINTQDQKLSKLEGKLDGVNAIDYLLEGYTQNVTSGQALKQTIVNTLSIPEGKSFFIKVSLTESAELSSWRFKTIAADGNGTNTDTIYQFGTWIEIPARDYVVTTLKWNSITAVNTGTVRVDVAYITNTEGLVKQVKKLEESIVNKQERLEVGTNLDSNAIEGSNNPITSDAVFGVKEKIESSIIGKNEVLFSNSRTPVAGNTFKIVCNTIMLKDGESVHVKVNQSVDDVITAWRCQLLTTIGTHIGYVPSSAISIFDEYVEIKNTFGQDAGQIVMSVGSSYIGGVSGTVTFTIANVVKGLKDDVEKNTIGISDAKEKIAKLEVITTTKNPCMLARNINLSSGQEYEMDFKQYISKNMRIGFSCDIDNSFNSIEVGTIGYAASGNPLADTTKKYETRVIVDSNNITLWIKDSNSNYIDGEALPHGLTIADAIQIRLEETDINTVKIILTCNGQQFETTRNYENWHLYAPYCKANGCSINNGVLSFTTIDINKDILIIGDSYTRYVDTRWVYYMQLSGYGKNVILNGHSGAKTQNEGKLSLDTLIKICRPKYILWCLGMNDLEDDGTTADNNDGTINSKWIQGRDHLLEVCASNEITPVFTTIPSAYTHNNEAKNSWIRESGYLYVDFAKAVGAHWTEDKGGVWRYGLRENETTGLHPSTLGAKVLWQQIMIDFPQIMCE